MMDANANAAGELSCGSCGKRYVWRPEYEGKVLSCKCGAKIRASRSAVTVPVGAGAPAAPAAATRSAAPAGMTVPGYVMPHRAKGGVAEEEDDRSTMRDLIIPVVLLVIGVVGRIVELKVFGSAGAGMGVAAALSLGGMMLGVIALFAGAFGTAQFMGAELDPPATLGLKILAIAAFAAFVAVACASIDKEPGGVRGLLIALHVLLLGYFFFMCWLIKLDLLEALMATVITLAVQGGLTMAVARSLPEEAARVMFYGS